MKKILSIIMGISLIFVLTACSSINNVSSSNEQLSVEYSSEQSSQSSENKRDKNTTTDKMKNALVVYFSCTGNTKDIANLIVENTGADIYEIIPKEKYTSEDLDYNDSESRTSKEQNDIDARPEISGKVDNMDKYETIFIGYPIWWGEAPRIMNTFMESYDFSGKTLIPFCTSGSSDIGNSADALEELSNSNSVWFDGQRFSSSSTSEEVGKWIEGLNLK